MALKRVAEEKKIAVSIPLQAAALSLRSGVKNNIIPNFAFAPFGRRDPACIVDMCDGR